MQFLQVGLSQLAVQNLQNMQEMVQKFHIDFDCDVVGVTSVGLMAQQKNAATLEKMVVSGIDAHVGNCRPKHRVDGR